MLPAQRMLSASDDAAAADHHARRTRLAALAVMAFVVLTWPLGLDVGVQDHDESLYAEIAREMVDRGLADAWDTVNNWRGWYGHPALSMWVVAASYKVLGVTPLAVRIPAALEAALLVALAAWLARRMWGKDSVTAPVAAAFMATLPGMSLMGHNVKVDLNLIVFTTLSVLAAMKAWERPVWWLASGAAAGFAVLAKGPFGVAMPGAVALAAMLWERQAGRVMARGWPWMVAGLATFAAVVLPWNLAMYGRHGDRFVETQLLGSTMARFGSTQQYGDGTTPAYFLHTLLWAAAPLVPLGLWALWVRAREAHQAGWRAPPPWPVVDLTWLLVPLAVMGLSAMKLPHYIFPVFPALCATAARSVAPQQRAAGYPWMVWWGSVGINVLMTGFALAMITICFPPRQGVGLLLLWLLGMAVVVVASWMTLAHKDVVALWAGPCSAAALAMAMHNGAARPELHRFQPGYMVADVLNQDGAPLGPGTDVLSSDDFHRMSVVWLMHRQMDDLPAPDIETRIQDGPRYLLVPADKLPDLRQLGYHTRVRGFALSFTTSHFSIPFAMVGNREDLARPTVFIQVWRGATPPPPFPLPTAG